MLKIKEVRKLKKMSQDELARATGCTQSAISQYEIGETNPSLEMLVKIAAALEVSVDDLIIKEVPA